MKRKVKSKSKLNNPWEEASFAVSRCPGLGLRSQGNRTGRDKSGKKERGGGDSLKGGVKCKKIRVFLFTPLALKNKPALKLNQGTGLNCSVFWQ